MHISAYTHPLQSVKVMDCEGILSVGTQVSAKFKGAFCEAVIKEVTPSLDVRVDFQRHSKSIHCLDSGVCNF